MGRVFVAGSINMDVVATADRHPRIGETVAGHAVRYFPGGKGANQAVAAARLGAPTTLIGRLGKDAFGDELRTFLAAQGVDLSFGAGNCRRPQRNGHHHARQCRQHHRRHSRRQCAGECGRRRRRQRSRRAISRSASSRFRCPRSPPSSNAPARPARPPSSIRRRPSNSGAALLDLVDILILNETELGLLAKRELRDTDDHARFIDAARSLRTGPDQIICVTLGKRGMLALLDGEPLILPGRAVTAVDTTGAGDCFVGAVAAQLAGGKSIRDALDYANAAASICVQRMGAAPSMPTAEEVSDAISRSRPGEFSQTR